MVPNLDGIYFIHLFVSLYIKVGWVGLFFSFVLYIHLPYLSSALVLFIRFPT